MRRTAGIRRIKSHDGLNRFLSGNSTLTSTLLEHGLADQIPLLVYPVLSGKGKRIFAEGALARAFGLASTKVTPSDIYVMPKAWPTPADRSCCVRTPCNT